MKQLNQVIKSLKQQWFECNLMKLMEYKTTEDYLLVNLELVNKGIEFSFDSDGHQASFSGEIVKINDNRYLMKFTQYNESLDSYIQAIDDEITEGFLLPNGLYYCED